MDTKRLNFWKESIEKEAMARDGIKFFVKGLIVRFKFYKNISKSGY